MWFADLGEAGAAVLLTCWALAVVAVLLGPRLGLAAAGGLLTPATRAPVLTGTGAATVLFAAQAGVVDAVADRGGTTGADVAVLDWFVARRTPGTTAVMDALSTVGSTVVLAVAAALAVGALWWRRHRVEAAVVAVASGVGAALVVGFKNLYDRPRPPVADRLAVETNASLPSGHALGSTVVLGVLAAVTVVLVRRRLAQVAVVATTAVGVVAIGVSRLYLGVHWASDVLTGWLLGSAWLAACVTALVVLRRRATGPDAAEAQSPR